MNNDELLLKKELAESSEWKQIRRELLEYCSLQSGNDLFCDKYLRGMLYGVKFIDNWAATYYEAVKKKHEKEGN